MVNETSIQAYRIIRDNGYLKKRTWDVYDTVHRYGPITQAQTAKLLGVGHNRVTAAFKNLRELGYLKEYKKVVCPTSGHSAWAWIATDNYERPKPVKRRKEDKNLFTDLYKCLRWVRQSRKLLKEGYDKKYADNLLLSVEQVLNERTRTKEN